MSTAPSHSSANLPRLISVTGYARGGTTWLRDCIGAHPEIGVVTREMTLFRDHCHDPETLWAKLREGCERCEVTEPWVVEKSPANAPMLGEAAAAFPDVRFVFIMRDPRDVFVSHKRGTFEWMGGRNSVVHGCMSKIRDYHRGYEQAADRDNVLLVRYEELHQDFEATMQEVFEFIGVDTSPEIIKQVFDRTNFWKVATRHQEQRDRPRRKGVVGDWVNFLTKYEQGWYRCSPYWRRYMRRYGYDWHQVTYGSILRAMRDGAVHFLDEQDAIAADLDEQRPNAFILHDIDLLKTKQARDGVREIARIEGKLGVPGVFNFLPLDDVRYAPLSPEKIVSIVREVQQLSPRAAIGLHLNATERFFPHDAPEADETHPDIEKCIAYLHEQIDAWAEHGVEFTFATAHGYGRKMIPPHNGMSIFRHELAQRGIRIFDNDVRLAIQEKATQESRIHDVGGALTAKRFPNNGAIDDPETYRAFPAGSLINFLAHPGNYDVRHPLTLGLRTNVPERLDLSAVKV